MKLNQEFLVIVLRVLETTELTTTDDIKFVTNGLTYLHLITDYQSWKAVQKNLSNSLSIEQHEENSSVFFIDSDELLLKTMLALNRSYIIQLGQHNLLKILKVSDSTFPLN